MCPSTSRDVDEALDFYVGSLGMTVRADRPDFGFGGAWLDVGDQQVHLIERQPPQAEGQHFAIRVAALDDVVAGLRAVGVEVERSRAGRPGAPVVPQRPERQPRRAAPARLRAVPRDPRHDILFEPLAIGPKTLRNRFYQVPHCTGFGVEKPFSQARHRAMKAEGGWAAVCTEFCSISPEATETPCRLWDDDDVRALAIMCDEVHAHGALAGVELHHGGANSRNRSRDCPPSPPPRLPATTSSSPRRPCSWPTSGACNGTGRRPLDRAERAGFDIVYVYGAHSYLPMQFLSTYYNRRSDAYGGSLENRARFWLETLTEVRAAVGDRCAVASRIAVDALGPAGVELDEALSFVSLADHLVDLWDVNVGSIEEWSKDSGSSRFFAEGYQLEWTGKVRSVTDKPIVGVARLTSPDRMADIVRSGVWDLVGSARQSIADPFLPEKMPRAGSTTSASARATTSARARGECGTSAAHRMPPPARSTGGVGIPSGSRGPRTAIRTYSLSGRGRPAWNAPRPREKGDAPGPSCRRRRRDGWLHALDPAAAGARGMGPSGRLSAGADRQARQRGVRPPHPARCRRRPALRGRDRRGGYGRRWAGDGLSTRSARQVPGADPSSPYCLTPSR